MFENSAVAGDGNVVLVAARLRAAGCVFAEDEAELLIEAASRGSAREAPDTLTLDALVARRVAGEPLEHVVGWAAFCGERIAVGPGVFVPRRRSEFLAARACALGAGARVVVDMCCGAAPLATVLAARLAQAVVHAADVDASQAVYARRNLERFGDRARVHVGDLFAALPEDLAGRIDLIAANAPYVPTGEFATLPAEARLFEPAATLDGGGDGLDIQRRIALGAGKWLAAGGHLLVETSRRQATASLAALRDAGLAAWLEHDDDLEATIVVGRKD